ncbi:MAG: sigma 54-interacting transcriptional regulator [Syntrophorhabdaceae bacterium]|nr:sigma 54-interacting transcriptional regulator [Syntrophorhabdaceae bacterium]
MDENLSHRILEDRQFMVVRLDRAGNITYVNSYFLKLTGYAETEVLNKNWFGDLRSGGVHDGMKDAFRKTMEEGAALSDYENAAISKLDDRLLVHWSSVIERDASGKATGIIAIGEDITEYHRAIKALQNERSQMNVVLSSLNTGLALMNREMTVEWVNETMMRVLSSGDPIGRKCYGSAGRHSGPCEDCPALLTFKDAQIHERDLLNPVNGRWYHVVAQPVKDTTHCVAKVLESVTDITEQKLAGESLRKSEEKFRGFFTCSPDYCYIISPEGVILDTNDAALDITGYRKEELIGRTFTTLYSAESLPKVKQLFESQRWREKGELRGEELVITDRNGRRRIVLLSAGAVRDGQGKIVHSTSIQTDITELKRIEEARIGLMKELETMKNRLEEENIYLRKEIRGEEGFSDIIGKSNGLLYVLMRVKEVAPTDSTVLIEGETGVGKERVARAIHNISGRVGKPFITVNCAALPQALAESELFGHEPGAFTGAQRLRKGRFELADGGTIFLDEVGEMPPEIQVKLLRVLQNQEFERVGGTHTLRVNVRVITATNHVLLDEVAAGRFRPDLFYRLNVYPITVPPLRKRREDIPLLVEFFVKDISTRMGKQIDRIAPDVLEQFKAYDWPGNIRELMNVVERAVIISRDAILRLPRGALGGPAPPGPDGFTSLKDNEKQYIVRALEVTGWRVSGPKGAAKLLGVNPSTLESKIKKLGIRKDASTLDAHRK